MVENRRPEQPERLIRRREERRVAVRIARRIGHQELGAPFRLSLGQATLPRSPRRPTSLAAAGIPGREQASILRLHHARGMIVLGIDRENRALLAETRVGSRHRHASQPDERPLAKQARTIFCLNVIEPSGGEIARRRGGIEGRSSLRPRATCRASRRGSTRY